MLLSLMGLTVVGNESWLGGGVVLEETKFAYCLAMLAVSDWIDFWEDGKGAIICFFFSLLSSL